jgi:hypothetical protein
METTTTKKTVMGRCYSYAAVSRALAQLFGAHSPAVQKGAFRGRLQHLRRLGLPETTPGRGKAAPYTELQIYKMMIALQLEEAGVDPKWAAALAYWHTAGPRQTIRVRERQLAEIIHRALNSPGGDSDVVLMLVANLMSSAWADNVPPAVFRDETLGSLKASGNLESILAMGPGVYAFNLSRRLRELHFALEAIQPEKD